MSENGIFRKASLERLSTPEQLDYLMQVTTPKGWYALYTCCGLLLLALGWSIFGRLPTTISGRAIIMPPHGVDDVYAPETGLVSELLVKEGDEVHEGQVVAHLEQSDLAAKGARSKKELELKVSASEERIRFLERQVRSKREALSLGLIPPSDLENTVNQLENTRTELQTARNQLEAGGAALKLATEVKAPKAGRVVELLASVGERVTNGDAMMTYVTGEEELGAVAFIPEIGNQARPDMAAEISPNTIKKEEFGYLKGTVTYVSDFPARTHMLYSITHNRILNQELAAAGSPYIIRMKLEKAPDTYSGFAWSSGRGPKEKVKAGMMCTVRVIVRQQRPISLVIPALKSLLGV
jgi:HlyD family secretion protein